MKGVIFLSILSVLLLGVESMSYNHTLTLKEGISEVSYTYNSSMDSFYFKLKVKTTGWAGLALTLEKGSANMKNYDIALGGVQSSNSSNATYFNDYWSAEEVKPTLDTKQDFKIVHAMEKDGWTTLEFYRKADTKDTNHDVKIEKGKAVYFAWARSDKDAVSKTDFNKHGDKAADGRGHLTVGYDLYTGKVVVEPTTPSASGCLVPSTVLVALAALYQYFA